MRGLITAEEVEHTVKWAVKQDADKCDLRVDDYVSIYVSITALNTVEDVCGSTIWALIARAVDLALFNRGPREDLE